MEKSFHCYISQYKFDHSAEKYKPKTLGPLKQNAFLGQAMCMLGFLFLFVFGGVTISFHNVRSMEKVRE